LSSHILIGLHGVLVKVCCCLYEVLG